MSYDYSHAQSAAYSSAHEDICHGVPDVHFLFHAKQWTAILIITLLASRGGNLSPSYEGVNSAMLTAYHECSVHVLDFHRVYTATRCASVDAYAAQRCQQVTVMSTAHHDAEMVQAATEKGRQNKS